jgi:hypothetical protein
MAEIVLLSAFSNSLRGFFIRKLPIQKIKSWIDLYENFKDVKIDCLRFLPMSDFAENDESDMAQDFKSRLDVIYIVDLLKPKNKWKYLKCVYRSLCFCSRVLCSALLQKYNEFYKRNAEEIQR